MWAFHGVLAISNTDSGRWRRDRWSVRSAFILVSDAYTPEKHLHAGGLYRVRGYEYWIAGWTEPYCNDMHHGAYTALDSCV
jgi:hypothetical protein